MHEFQVIEDAVLATLAPLKGQGVKLIDIYSGQLDGADEFAKLITQFPCVLIGAGDLQVGAGNQVDLVRCEIDLIVGDRNLRGPAAAARGDAISPGIYALLAAIRDRLNDRPVIADWSRPAWLAEGRLHVDYKAAICLYAAKYEIRRAIRRN